MRTPERRRVAVALAAACLSSTLAACASEPPALTDLPAGVSAVADQTRLQRQGREVFVRVSNDGDEDLVVESLVLGSDRTPEARSSAGEIVRAGYEGDVEVELPPGECGGPPRFVATLTYRVGGDDERRSRLDVDDRYGALTRVLDADCVARTLADAGELDVGDPVREGDLLRVPVAFTPAPGAPPDLTLVGYRGTPLVRPATGSATDVALTARPVRADLVLEPARCDPHAVAEDKVGRLIPVELDGAGLPDQATFTLPLSHDQKADVMAYVRAVCRLD